MKTNIGRGSASGKVILMGEHAVVYGQAAIAIPFEALTCKTSIYENKGDVELDCYYYKDKLLQVPEILSGLKEMIKEILDHLGEEMKDFTIKVESTIPPERGIGSSAAVAIATIRALYDYFGKDLSYDQLMKWAHVSEKIVHGNPSGIDTATIGGGKPIYYIRGQDFKRLELDLPAYLIVADSGRKGQTKEAVGDLRKWIDENPQVGLELIEELGDLSNRIKEAIEIEDIRTIGQSMTRGHEILDKLGVSDSSLNRLVEQALDRGALGAKLTGGGRGGSMIALASSRESSLAISRGLKENGARNSWIHYLGADENEN